MLEDLFEESDPALLERHNIDVVVYDDEWREKYLRAVEREHEICRVLTPEDGDWGG